MNEAISVAPSDLMQLALDLTLYSAVASVLAGFMGAAVWGWVQDLGDWFGEHRLLRAAYERHVQARTAWTREKASAGLSGGRDVPSVPPAGHGRTVCAAPAGGGAPVHRLRAGPVQAVPVDSRHAEPGAGVR